MVPDGAVAPKVIEAGAIVLQIAAGVVAVIVEAETVSWTAVEVPVFAPQLTLHL